MFEPELIIFGGTFDPPHLGHRQVVEEAHRRFTAAAFLVCPNPQTPIVEGHLKASAAADFADRLQMCRILFGGLSDRVRLEVSDIESRLTPPFYTEKLLKHLTSTRQGLRIAFLMGEDQIVAFDQWHNPRGILNEADLVVVSRPVGDGKLEENTKAMLQRLEITAVNDGMSIHLPEFGRRIYLISEPVSTAQSSLLRSDFKDMNQLRQHWLPKDLKEFIDQKKLYQAK